MIGGWKEIQKEYPKLFMIKGFNFENEIFIRGEECENPRKLCVCPEFISFYLL